MITDMHSQVEIITRVMEIVSSSNRAMPAHFNSSGDRTQSFGIDFEPLTANDEYNMASEAWNGVSEYVKEVSSADNSLIVLLGEDYMLSAYVVTKLGHPELIDEVVSAAHKRLASIFTDEKINKVVSIPGVNDYLDSCKQYGGSFV
jgi:hypothetical protein